MASTAEVPQEEQSGSATTDYDALLQQAKAERGDPLASQFDTAAEGRSDDVRRDEARARGAEKAMSEGLQYEADAATRRSKDQGEVGQTHLESFAREDDRNATDSFSAARRGAREAGKAFDEVEAAQARLDSLTDPDRTA